MLKAIIFDLDGVLLSTDEYHFLAWKKLADRLGIPFDRKKNDLLRGISRMASLEIVLDGREFSDEQKAALAEEKNATYRQYLSAMTPDAVAPDTVSALDLLKARGLKLAVGSSSKNTKYILERVDLIDKFDVIVDGNDVAKSKPDPEVFLKAAERLGFKPEECMVVEDAVAGIEAAVAGGFIPVAIAGARVHEKAKYRIERLSELSDIPETK